MRRTLAGGATCLGLAAMSLLAAGCGGTGQSSRRTKGPSDEYRVAQVVRSFLVAYVDGDTDIACGRLTSEQRQLVARRSGEPSCQRALPQEVSSSPTDELDRLRRARVTKVDVAGEGAKAEITLPPTGRERLTAQLLRREGKWEISSDLSKGGLASGRVPRPPPGPPRSPAEEHRVAAVFAQYRRAVSRGDGSTACALLTESARRHMVQDAVKLDGGRPAAIKEFGALDCRHVAPHFAVLGRLERVVVQGDRARLTLRTGSKYPFRKIRGEWRLDT